LRTQTIVSSPVVTVLIRPVVIANPQCRPQDSLYFSNKTETLHNLLLTQNLQTTLQLSQIIFPKEVQTFAVQEMMMNTMGDLEAALGLPLLVDQGGELGLFLAISRIHSPVSDEVKNEVKPTQIHLQGFAELQATEAGQLPPSAKLVQAEVLKIRDKAR
jgi:hypothetical protein